MADLFVNDAFGTAHRAHCSTTGVASYLPAACGYLIQKEIRFMGGALADPKRPLVAILGGAKVSDKIGVISNLIDKVRYHHHRRRYGLYLYEVHGPQHRHLSAARLTRVDKAGEMMQTAKDKGVKFLIPVDNRCGKEYKEDTEVYGLQVRRYSGRLDGPGHRS